MIQPCLSPSRSPSTAPIQPPGRVLGRGARLRPRPPAGRLRVLARGADGVERARVGVGIGQRRGRPDRRRSPGLPPTGARGEGGQEPGPPRRAGQRRARHADGRPAGRRRRGDGPARRASGPSLQPSIEELGIVLGRHGGSGRQRVLRDLTASPVAQSRAGLVCHDEPMSSDESREGVALTHLDQAVGRRNRHHEARVGRLPRRDARRLRAGARRPAAVGDPGAAWFRNRSCRRTCRSTRRTGSAASRCGPSARSARSRTRCATTGARCCGWPTSARSSSTRRCSGSLTTDSPTHLVLDIDPPENADFSVVVRAAELVHQALLDVGLDGAVKTSGAKGVHIFVPIDVGRAGAGRGGLAGDRGARRGTRPGVGDHRVGPGRARRQGLPRLDPSRRRDGSRRYSPRMRAGLPVSFPLELGRAGARSTRRG